MKTLGKYKILGTLGAGAFGTVYHGLDPIVKFQEFYLTKPHYCNKFFQTFENI